VPESPARPDPGTAISVSPIGFVETGFARPQDAPPQAGMAFSEQGRLVVSERFAPGLSGLAAGRYVWLLTWLHDQSDADTEPLRVVPRGWEGTGRDTGVYATRTPNRHNRLGLSLVRVRSVDVEGGVLHFDGVDMVDGTPVLDVKPWSNSCDLPDEAR
jgi:tRNA-Thr(GGU) m(6)t(6)A37 methyltransferase TsaA